MTGPGTNTYLVGGVDDVVVIDPGPDVAEHLDRIVGAAPGPISRILCTHTHRDHSPGAAGLAERTGAEVSAFGSRDGLIVDRALGDGDVVAGPDVTLRVLHTPGHASNHLCFLLEEEGLLFSGDHVMGGSTVVISPPDGDMAAYLTQLERLGTLALRAIAPGHGDLMTDPGPVVARYLAHRRAREQSIVDTLAGHGGSSTVDALVAELYAEVDPARHRWAAQSVWAHLLKLAGEGRVRGHGRDDEWVLVT